MACVFAQITGARALGEPETFLQANTPEVLR